MKFGSSVLVEPTDVPKVASDIYAEVRQGRKVVAVVSAFAGDTDRLLSEARAAGLTHDNAMLPGYVVMGEERAARLVAIACDRVGLDACTLSVRELGIRAAGLDEHAVPIGFDGDRLKNALDHHDVVVVPGFGATGSGGRVVLLGRGGSDLTGVFLASELRLDCVQLIKDVDGLYDRDPATHAGALRYDQASWEKAAEIGGDLIQPEALDLAARYRVEVEVRNYLDGHRTRIGFAHGEARPVPHHRPLRVALAGCGVVGGGILSRLLSDPRVEVTGVLVRSLFKVRDVPGGGARVAPLLTTSADDLFAPRPDVVIDALSDGEEGRTLLRRALELGLDAVSANKQAVSRDPGALQALANKNDARLLWSAAVGGGAPMVEAIRQIRARTDIVGFEAVLNGTINYVLDRMSLGDYFDIALQSAREAGFAEENPASDLEGFDAAAKAQLLAYEAWGVALAFDDIARTPLEPMSAVSSRTRQIVRCRLQGGRPVAEVLLTDRCDPLLSGLRGERNAILITTADGSVVRRQGRGAGRWPTVESVLADLSALMSARTRR